MCVRERERIPVDLAEVTEAKRGIIHVDLGSDLIKRVKECEKDDPCGYRLWIERERESEKRRYTYNYKLNF